jgi:membrane associated rhomboid family serine protease
MSIFREQDELLAQYAPHYTRRIIYTIVISSIIWLFLQSLLAPAEPLLSRITGIRADQAILQGHVWQFLLYPWGPVTIPSSIPGILNLVFTVILFMWLGGRVENEMGSRRFLRLLAALIIAPAVVQALALLLLRAGSVPFYGFGGVLLALFTVVVLWSPREQIMIFFVIPMQLRLLALFVGIYTLLTIALAMRAEGTAVGFASQLILVLAPPLAYALLRYPGILDRLEDFPKRRRRRSAKIVPISMGHPGRHSDPDDRYNDPHWRLDQ